MGSNAYWVADCPYCGGIIQGHDEEYGTTGHCPHCAQIIAINAELEWTVEVVKAEQDDNG